MKLAVGQAPPLWLAAIRFASSGICLFGANLIRRGLYPPPVKDLPIVFSIGLLQMAAFTGLGMIAMQHTNAGKASLLAYSTPLWSVLVAWIIFRERPTMVQVIAVVTGMLGIAIICSPPAMDWENSKAPIGAMFLIVAAICWSVVILHVRRRKWTASPLQLALWEMTFASVLRLPLAWLVEGSPAWVERSPDLLLLIAYFGPVATSFCFVVSADVGRRISSFAMSNATLGVPIVDTITSIAFLQEWLSILTTLGFSLIVAGIVVAGWAVRVKARANRHTRERDANEERQWPVGRV
jgi:drug/metabolite transporter (DMT)-like permease